MGRFEAVIEHKLCNWSCWSFLIAITSMLGEMPSTNLKHSQRNKYVRLFSSDGILSCMRIELNWMEFEVLLM